MINLELPKKMLMVQQMSHQLASTVFRPISRKYDKIEHCDTPEELRPVAQMIAAVRPSQNRGKDKEQGADDGIKNGANLTGIVGMEEMCWGDVGLMLSIPGTGLGNAAVMALRRALSAPSARTQVPSRVMPIGSTS